MNNKINISIILIILLSGCIGSETITGKYVLEENHKAYFILHDDSTLSEWFSDGTTGSGMYRYENKQLFLTYIPFGNVNVLDQTKEGFKNKRGGIYVKQ